MKRTVGGYFNVQGRADDTMNLGGIKVLHCVYIQTQLRSYWNFSQVFIFCFSVITQTSSIEIERVCDQADECISETAAVSLTPPNGGPELLVIFAVLKEGFMKQSEEELKLKFSRTIQKDLNPLFKVINIFDGFHQLKVTKSFCLLTWILQKKKKYCR